MNYLAERRGSPLFAALNEKLEKNTEEKNNE
jgi:hypothetical protein